MTSAITGLKKITQVLLADESSYADMRQACVNLLQLFYDASGFDENDPVNDMHMQTAAGQAVSPQSAAVCIRDFMRTRVFMRGLKEAISTRLQENPDKPVTVLYAGTGPFATLLIPLVTVFSTAQLKMLLLDINPASIAYMNRVIRYFTLEPYVLEVLEADAVTWRIPAAYKPDIILSETMMPSLKTEPQVSITINLVAQCPQAIMIPEMIEVSAALLNSKMGAEKRCIHLKTLLVLTKEEALETAVRQQTGDVLFPVTELLVEKPVEEMYRRLALLTSIRVFNNEILGFNESSLTIAEIKYNLQAVKAWPAVFYLQYSIFPVPGFMISTGADSLT